MALSGFSGLSGVHCKEQNQKFSIPSKEQNPLIQALMEDIKGVVIEKDDIENRDVFISGLFSNFWASIVPAQRTEEGGFGLLFYNRKSFNCDFFERENRL